MDFEQFQQAVTECARSAGLTRFELYYTRETARTVSAMEGEITECSDDTQAGCCFRCIVNGRMGYCATELFTPEEAARIVAKAAENAATIEKDDPVFLFAGSEEYKSVPGAPIAETDMRALALELYGKALAADERVQPSTQAYVSRGQSVIRLVNSAGLDLTAESTRQAASLWAVVRRGEEQFNAGVFRDEPLEQVDTEAAAAQAVGKAIDKIGGESVPSGTWPVIFHNEAFADLLTAFVPIFSAKSAQQGLSLLAGKEGETIAAACVTFIDDPFRPGYETPFDGEGVAARVKTVVDKGVFQTLLYNLETAARAGRETTGNASRPAYYASVGVAPFNFYLQPGEASPDTLYRAIGDGLLITELAGLHAGLNSVTGDFSLMAAGYRIENGQKGRFVNGITVSGNFFALLKNIRAVGSDLRFGAPMGVSRIGAPSVWAGELSVAGQ